MTTLRASLKLVRALTHLGVGLFTILLRFPGFAPAERQVRVQRWSLQMLNYLGVRLVVRGTPPVAGPVLLVANHISWLDITALHAALFCRFVAKADLRQWPVVGALAAGTGSLFIERASRRDAMRVVHQMADSLRAGDVLAIFPEGTTSDGLGVLPFHANLFEAAIAAAAPVQPVALQFIDQATGQRSAAPCYINDDTLWGSVWRTVKANGITVVITFGDPQPPRGRPRRVWAADVQAAVVALRQPLDLAIFARSPGSR